jgi:hypothetical protein
VEDYTETVELPYPCNIDPVTLKRDLSVAPYSKSKDNLAFSPDLAKHQSLFSPGTKVKEND